MFGIHKISPLLVGISLSQIFTIYDIQALQRLSEDFQENILGGVILVCNCQSEQLVCNLTKRRTLTPVFSGDIFENGWLRRAASEQSKPKIYKKTFLVELFWYTITTQSPASRVQRPESSVQSPASRVQGQTLASRVQEIRYAERIELPNHLFLLTTLKSIFGFLPECIFYSTTQKVGCM